MVFLTREGDEPSDDAWTTYTYRDIHDVLARVRKTNEASIGDDVRTFLDHYLNLIGSRFMDDPKIDELCQLIYKNHRQAIDLIVQYIPTPATDLIRNICKALSDDERFKVTHHVDGTQWPRVSFQPIAWAEVMPEVCSDARFPRTGWLYINTGVKNEVLSLDVWVGPVTDQTVRSLVIDRLTVNASEFGFKTARKQYGAQWARLCERTHLLDWQQENMAEHALQWWRSQCNDMFERLIGVPDALRLIIEEWQKNGGKPTA